MSPTILLLEDEPLILMDLEYAAQDEGCEVLIAASSDEALATISKRGKDLSVAVLDVSLGGEATCLPVARKLDELGIPYILHSGDLDRHDETIRQLNADLIAKPACAGQVIAAALACAPKHAAE